MTAQLPLPFRHRPDHATADFLRAGSNEAAMAWLDRTAEWPDHRLALWGEGGCGKTHLLHIWARGAGATVLSGPALASFTDLPEAGPIGIDDADGLADETALFHILNACREAGRPLLLTARLPPARWTVRLPDLMSRLRSIVAVGIGAPEDSLLRALLARLLAERQMTVAQPVQEWLLLRLPRTAAALREAVALLDEAALAARAPITRALAGRTLSFDDLHDISESSHDPPGTTAENALDSEQGTS